MANKPISALLMPLLWATALVLAAFGAQAGAVFTSLYSFSGTNDGAYPGAPLVQGRDGNFYGTTESGGNTNLNGGSGYGTVFKVTASGTLTNLHSFYGTNDGAFPNKPNPSLNLAARPRGGPRRAALFCSAGGRRLSHQRFEQSDPLDAADEPFRKSGAGVFHGRNLYQLPPALLPRHLDAIMSNEGSE
jgi:uncharacterized repeat protein (TIGR03803 family)